MPTLQADLDLQLEESLARVSELDDALFAAASRFSEELTAALAGAQVTAADVTIPVNADTSAAEAAVGDFVGTVDGEAAQLSLFADPAAAESAATDLLATIDGEEATISVDADTSAAEGALGDLADATDQVAKSATSGGQALGGLEQHAALLAGASGLAVGEVGGLREGASALGKDTALAAGGAFALAAGVTELFQAGLQATSAEQRFNAVIGETADQVERVHVGNLNEGLFELTARMGSTEAATRNAAATIFQFALNAGASRTQAAAFTDQIFALAARAVALNPALGDVTDVATRMEVGLGRARSAAQQFGIAISQAEINARALQDTGKTSASELTAYEKSVAGAEIALARYGDTLDQTVSKGSQNAAIQQRRLTAEFKGFLEEAGKPLVAPGIQVMRDAIPVAERFAEALALIARGALPVIEVALQLLGPLIQPAVVGFVALEVALKAASIANFTFATSSGVATAGLEAETATTAAATAGIIGFSGSIAATAGLALAGAAAYEGTTLVLHALFGESKDYTAALQAEADATQKVTSSTEGGLVPAFRKLVDATHDANNNVGTKSGLVDTLRAFKDVAEADVGSAARLAEQFKGNAVVYRGMQQILAEVNQKHTESAAAQAANAQAADRLAVAANNQQKLVDAAGASQRAFASGTGSATQALKDEQAASQGAKDALSLYKDELDAVLGIHIDEAEASIQFANSLQKITDSVQKNGAALGLDNQAQRDNEQSVIDSAKAAETLAEATFRRVQATDGDAAATKAANDSLARFTVQIRDTLLAQGLSADAADALLRSLNLLTAAGDPTALSIEAWGQAAATSAPKVAAAGAQVGTASADGAKTAGPKHKAAAESNFVQYIAGVLAKTKAIVDAASGAASAAVEALNEKDPSFEAAGNVAGESVANGFSKGKTSLVDRATEAANDAVRALNVTDPQFQAAGNVLAESVASGVTEGGGRIGDGIRAASANALGVASAQDTLWHQIGVAWSNGVAQGITDGAGAISQAGLDALNTANTVTTALLNANSPSRLTRDILGKPYAEGIAEGIRVAGPGVSAAALGVINDAVDSSVAGLATALAAGGPAAQRVISLPAGSVPAAVGAAPGVLAGGIVPAPGTGGGPLVNVEHLSVATPSLSPVDAGFEAARQLGAELWRMGV